MQIHKHIKYSNTNQTLNVYSPQMRRSNLKIKSMIFLTPNKYNHPHLKWILFENLLYVKCK